MSTWRKSKLIQDIQLVHFIDLALEKENLNELTDEDLKSVCILLFKKKVFRYKLTGILIICFKLCFSRGLNPIKVERNILINYLKDWIRLSKKIDGLYKSFTIMFINFVYICKISVDKNVSLLLHAPVLLTYRMKSNEDLIKDCEPIKND